MTKTVRVGNRRHVVIRNLGFNSETNGYGYLCMNQETQKIDLAVRFVGEKEYEWYNDKKEWKSERR